MNNGVKSRISQLNYNEGVVFCQQVQENIHDVHKAMRCLSIPTSNWFGGWAIFIYIRKGKIANMMEQKNDTFLQIRY